MTLEHKNHFRRRRAAAEEMARVTPGSKGARFFAHAYAKYEQEAIDEEIVLNHAKAGELLDLRFIGPQAQSGSLPLHQFFDILKPLDSGLNAAAYRLRYGKESRRIDENTRDTMGLRLAGTGRGSMRVLVVGDGRFDTTGVNVLQSTLTQTFRLLTASNTEFFDAVDAVGGKAARYLGSALHMTVRHGLATEFSWQRSDQSTLRWDGAPNEIRRVCALIESTKEPEVYEEVLRGSVGAMNDNGTIWLRVGQERIRVRFPLKLIAEAQRLTLAESATLKVSTARYYDTVMKRDVFQHTLIEVQ